MHDASEDSLLPRGVGHLATTIGTAQPRTMLDLRMFPCVFDTILSFCDTPTLARMRLSRGLYCKITPMLAHTVAGCDGDDCGGLANGGCAYWKWKEWEDEHRAEIYDWGSLYKGTIKIVQLLQTTTREGVMSGMPIGVERATTVVLPINIRIARDMHYGDHLCGFPRLVWYPTDTHPGADYRYLPMVTRALELVINYKRWVGREGVADTEGLEAMVDLLREPFQSGMVITFVAPPEDVFTYIETALHNLSLPQTDDDPDLVFCQTIGSVAELSADEYAAKIGALAEAIESSMPPEGMGWRTFLVTSRLGQPRDPPSPPADGPATMLQRSGMNPWLTPDSESGAAMSPAWIPHRTSVYPRPPLTRSRSH